jgi:hypothetical protein
MALFGCAPKRPLDFKFPPRPQKASEKNSVWKMRGVFLPPPISHHVRAQASGKIASRKIVCSCERVRRFLPAIFSVRHPRKRVSELGLVSRVSPVQTALRNCTRDEGRPFEVGNQVLISSHRKLLSSKAMVVNVAEKSGQDSGRQG